MGWSDKGGFFNIIIAWSTTFLAASGVNMAADTPPKLPRFGLYIRHCSTSIFVGKFISLTGKQLICVSKMFC